ncbi:3-oxoacyl-[acyl-carrier-protein] reductase FabG [Microbulbifer aggregans]|uniref:3-oxoacyl-[acyl-carrier-protein] reductase FabG n=1 Tax=Microbulbifer aggregans TaxID=1769779 RepID=A0A1C9W6H2_9GAMM|nr:pteridine reductase [Microbulbifer aggregans]AOS96745.1 3-oxoacyl-[acyl-carrier-protein] reductase FabG [Microbulbifer aggregans]
MRNVLITGAAARLGRAIARELHRDHRIIIHYRRSASAAQRLVRELNEQRPDSAAALQSDLDSAAGCEQLAQHACELWGGVDVLVNNASSFYPTPVGKADERDWDQLVGSNLKAPFFLSQALTPSLTENSGSIINMIDIHAERPMPQHTIYCAAKAGLVMLTKSLALELAPKVRVNGVAPGAILWPEQEDVDEEAKARTLSRIPLGRTGSETDIARTVRFLISEPSYISGQVIAVDGGRSLNI